MKARLLILVALGVALVAIPAVALGGGSRGAANSITFPDSTGKNPNAPDITSTVVSNDDAGNITFQINISNRPALTPDMFLLIFLDTDQNATTGDASSLGADYAIQLDSAGVELFQWNGTDYVAAPAQASLIFSYTTAGATIRISAADLNKTRAFKFATLVASGVTTDATGQPNFSTIQIDSAPDSGHGFYTYQVLTKLVLTVTAFTVSPKPAKAGRPLSVSLAANENDTAGPVESGTVACAASLAGKRLAASTHVVANGVASCVWRLPKTSRGRLIRGTITLTVQGVSVTRIFSAKIS